MKRAIFKSILLAAGIIACQDTIHAQQTTRSSYTGITVPVKNGNVSASLRGKAVSQKDAAQNLASMLGLSASHTFKQVTETKDNTGITHTSYQQYYLGVKVDGGQVLVHSKDGMVNTLNGKVAQLGTLSVQPVLKATEAYTAAKKSTTVTQLFKSNYPVELVIAGVNKQYSLAYKVRIDGRTADRKVVMVNVFVDAVTGKILNTVSLMAHNDIIGTANTLYSGIKPLTIDSVADGFRLRDNARKIETYNGAGAEMDNQGFFINNKDFYNNTNYFDLFNTFSSTTISTAAPSLLDNLGGQSNFMLYALADEPLTGLDMNFASDPAFVDVSGQSSLPATNTMYNILNPAANYTGVYMNIHFLSWQNIELADTAYYPMTNLTVGSHPWADTKGNSGSYAISMEKNPAVDAHWGMQKTHDFYSTIFNRNSYDNLGSVVKNYVNSGDQNNASASPEPYNVMQYGMGDGSLMNPVVGLDVMGHEFTHMVTEHNGHGGLEYQGESGALNESFSDIFGTAIEFFAKGADANWNIGEGIIIPSPGYFRSMATPKVANPHQPDTYQGTYWANPANTQDGDQGGVHTNSGVQNKWFYLLSQGGTGTNDKGDAYTVTGIGIAKAEKIAYGNLMNYITPTSDYMDAYSGSLEATIDLYGADTTSQEYRSVKQAWYAVGIGDAPTTGVNEIAINDNDLKIYPNPATGKVTIASSVDQKLEAQVLNVVGVPVMNITVTKGLNPIDISSLAKGVYMIRYNTGAKGFVQKLSVL
jgi:Zn-dependent metalloprotease